MGLNRRRLLQNRSEKDPNAGQQHCDLGLTEPRGFRRLGQVAGFTCDQNELLEAGGQADRAG